MRLVLAGLFLVSTVAPGQSLLDTDGISRVAKLFEPQAGEQQLHCEVRPIAPRVNFILRLQAGYVVSVPMKQYFGPRHQWITVTKVTPEGSRDPVYLASRMNLPDVPKTKVQFEIGGSYLVGEGRYSVDWLLLDDSNRICRKKWRVEGKLTPSERSLTRGMAPQTVGEASLRRWSLQANREVDARPIRRLTVLLHAAPIIARRTRLRAADRAVLLGSLVALLESLPAQSVRLVVFNLDQQKELFRQDVLTPDAFDQAAESMSNLKLQLVDYRVLQDPLGHVGLLTNLLGQELEGREPSDVVIVLGPTARYTDKLPDTAIPERSGTAPQFFYFQFKPDWERSGDFPDSIAYAIKRVRGKTIVIHNPGDFAKAIKQLETQVGGN